MVEQAFYVLDTNIAVFAVNGRSQTVREQYLKAEHTGRIAISAITEAEILYGLAKNPNATRTWSYMVEFLERTESLPWDSSAAAAYGLLRAKTEAVGLAVGSLDLQIAAHTVALGATLVTHDRALLKLSAFLTVVDWATDL